MKNILKSNLTTIIGVIILVGMSYKAVTEGFTISEAMSGLIAIGLILAKDFNKTHSS